MTAKEATETICAAVISALKIKLAPGECCPCCGHKKQNRRELSERMLAANRENVKKAQAAHRNRKKG